ncbi:MAG: glycosyltransferase family 39 protein, partial [Thermoanaerobaculia bacterium]
MNLDPRRRERWALALIVVLGAGLRLAYLVEIRDAPDFAKPGRDALYHDYWARAMLSGDWTPPPGKADPEIRTTPYMRPPGYPFFLAAAYGVSGGSYAGARAVQMLLGLVNAVLAWVLGRRLFGAATGLTFAALMATYWIFVYYEGELHAPVLAVLATLLLLLAFRHWSDSPTRGRALAAGAVLGGFALARPNVLVVLPFLLGWAFWVLRRRGERRRLVTAAAMVGLGVAIAVAPVTLRNRLAAGDRVLITTNAGINLYLSHNPEADGVTSIIPELGQLTGLAGWTCFEYPELVRGVGRELGRSPQAFEHSDASRYFFDRAVDWARRHPVRTLTSAIERALLFWGPAEVSNDEVVHFDRASSPVLRTVPGGFAFVLALAVAGGAGAFLTFRRRDVANGEVADRQRFEAWFLVVAFVAGYFASVLPTLAASRYRVPVIPCLLLFAAWGLVRWAEFWRRGEARRALATAF